MLNRTFDEVFNRGGIGKPTWAVVSRSGQGAPGEHSPAVSELEKQIREENERKDNELKEMEGKEKLDEEGRLKN